MVCALRCIRSLTLLILLGFALLTPAQSPAQAAGLLEKNFYLSGPNYDGVLPPCEAALSTISSRFAEKEGRFWNSNLQILDFERSGRSRSAPGRREPFRGAFAARLRRSAMGAATGSITGSARIPASSARPGASNGAWSASTATGLITRVARCAALRGAGRPRSGLFHFVLEMFLFLRYGTKEPLRKINFRFVPGSV